MMGIDPPIEATGCQDIHAQLISLRRRVEELEGENERLLSQLSGCCCSKENHTNSHTSELGSSNGTSQRGSHYNALNSTGTPGKLLASPGAPAKDSFGYRPLEKLTKFAELSLKDEPGRQPSTTHICAKRHVALRIMYFGKRFYGFASEAHTDPTVESEVFKALERTRLMVGSRGESNYSRCGRTDKGVSSTGQVISLYLRSNRKDTEGPKQSKNSRKLIM